MFKRIDHVEIVTDQLARTVQFYTEVLGFTVKARDRIERSGLGVPIELVYLDLGGTVVELILIRRRCGRPGSTNRASGIPHDCARSRRYAEDSRLSEDQGCRHCLGSKGSRDLLEGGDLRPQRLPHRAQAVVPLSGRANDNAGDLSSCRCEGHNE